ncbi:hypothetical protein QJQ45_020114 [Haematococcus lacustris]|nr:hypothetical protein QJQ45_020114 [Haematococcus lacustris]
MCACYSCSMQQKHALASSRDACTVWRCCGGWAQLKPQHAGAVGRALMVRQLGLALSLLAVDHSRAALDATHQTLHNHQMFRVVCCWLQIFNPPYVPTPDDEVQSRGLSSAWAGGFKGRRVIDRFMPQLSRVLRCGGQLLLVAVAENDPQGEVQVHYRFAASSISAKGLSPSHASGASAKAARLFSMKATTPANMPYAYADLIATMQATGHYTGAVVRSKQADEETLSIVQLTKL